MTGIVEHLIATQEKIDTARAEIEKMIREVEVDQKKVQRAIGLTPRSRTSYSDLGWSLVPAPFGKLAAAAVAGLLLLFLVLLISAKLAFVLAIVGIALFCMALVMQMHHPHGC